MSANNSHPTLPIRTHPPCHVVRGRPRDPAGTCRCEIEIGPAGSVLVLRVTGEIDMLTRPLMQTALTAALRAAHDQTAGGLVVDLAEMSFCCVRGFALLAVTARAAALAGIRFALAGLGGHHDRMLTMLWPDEPVVRYRTVAAAVTAIRNDHTDRLLLRDTMHRESLRLPHATP